MQHGWRASVLAAVLIGTSVLTLSAADPGVTFVGQGLVPGNALDLSGLAGQPICQIADPDTCIDQATLGGFGSGLTFTGHDDVFLAVPDRGPFDGRTDVPYFDRFHFLYMTVNVGAPFPNIKTVLLDTRYLLNESNQHFVGDSSAIANDDRHTLRFDPEGVRVSNDGNVFVSDEYGPYLFKFNRQGHLIRRIPVPEKFLIANPTGEVDDDGNSLELYPDHNTFGRQQIYKIDLNKPGLTDVSDVDSLPATAAELGDIVPVTKTKFLDLLDPDYKVDATHTIKDVIAEKIEALAWGPDLPDGRHLLYVVSDNDLFPELPTQIYAFAIDGSASGANISYRPQGIPGPMFPPGQVKKIIKNQ